MLLRSLTQEKSKKGETKIMALFEGYERRIDQINAVLNSYGISSIEEAEKLQKMLDLMYMIR